MAAGRLDARLPLRLDGLVRRLLLEVHLHHQDRDADDDPGVGHVEGRPDVSADQAEVEEVDHLAREGA